MTGVTRQIGNARPPATKLGLGTAPLGNMFARLAEKDAWDCLEAGWQAGARVFDTAPFYGYGLAERRLGDFLRTKPRDEYLLVTKVGRLLEPRLAREPTDTFFLSDMPFNPVFDYSHDAALRSHEDSLQRLGLDRVDILLIHDTGVAEHGENQPRVFADALAGAAKALFRLRDEGVIGAVGMGTNEWEVAEAALRRADFDTFLLAGRYTLLEQRAAASFLPLCVEREVNVILGGVYNSGLLASDDPAQATWNYAPAPPELVERALALKSVCDRHAVPLPAAAAQFAAAHPAVATVVIGSRSRAETEAAAGGLEAELPAGLWADFKDEGLLAVHATTP